ncbi:MAG: hypothetical protein GY842_18405, partial [bacterium]|nr:hypothetical protein [bacterium]
MSRSKRTAFRAVPLATVAWTCGLALAAANPPHLSEPPPQDPTRLDNHQTLVRRLEGNPRTLNPLFRASGSEYAVLELLYDAPFVFDAQMRWQLNSAVAESYQESDDHLSATLVLKT